MTFVGGRRWLTASIVVVAALALACPEGSVFVDGGPFDAGSVNGPGTFIALQRDFQGFQNWDRLYAGEGPVDRANTHVDSVRFVHINRMPGESDASFPIGSVIVKTHEIDDEPATSWEIFAMVKRGTPFNDDGARGWEFFEIGLTDEGASVIKWRGAKPPEGESYGCLNGACPERGSCNACHASAASNDFVLTPGLDFSSIFAANGFFDSGEN